MLKLCSNLFFCPYFLIKRKGLKVSDVYMEVGFKDFSHFSFAFKKAYGIAPSKVT